VLPSGEWYGLSRTDNDFESVRAVLIIEFASVRDGLIIALTLIQ